MLNTIQNFMTDSIEGNVQKTIGFPLLMAELPE